MLLLLTICIDNFLIGEGFHTYGINTIQHDGHSFIIYRTENGCSILHHPDCCK
jgi:hypothetical protein